MMKRVFLSAVVPAYNEVDNLKTGEFTQMLKWLKQQPFSKEVLIVDDGSTDETAKLIEKKLARFNFARLIRNRHHGKAYTVKRGVLEANGQLVLFTDFDQATPIKEVKKLIKVVQRGKDIAIGTREGEGSKREQEPLYRHLMGRAFNLLVRLLVLPEFADTQCGFKLFRRRAGQEVFKRLKHYDKQKPKYASVGAFDVEVLYLAKKLGFQIGEAPVSWRHFKTRRVSPLRDSIKMALELLMIRVRDALGKYD